MARYIKALGSVGLCIGVSLLSGCDSHATHPPDDATAGQTPNAGPGGGPSTPDSSDQNQSGSDGSGTGRTESRDYDWRVSSQMTNVGSSSFTGENYGSAFFQDIMSRVKQRLFNEPATTAHETLHVLHTEMRQKTQAKDGFYYHRDGKGIYVVEPKDNLADVKNQIAPSYLKLAKANYDTYVVGQLQTWKNTHYLLDEWACFVATTRTAIEVQAAGNWSDTFAKNNADPIRSVADMMYFNSAALISIKKVDPEYLKNNGQFKAAFAMMMEESMLWIRKAAETSYWQTSEAYARLDSFQNAEDSAAVRAAVKELMGETWANRVLGIK